jgi:PAS domain S-box-containing protein
VNSGPAVFDGEAMVVSVIRDVGARKKAEAHLEQLNRLYRTPSDVNGLIVRGADRPALFKGSVAPSANRADRGADDLRLGRGGARRRGAGPRHRARERCGVRPPVSLAFILDISERKKAEETLRDAEARTRAIVETAVDGIITIGEAGGSSPSARRRNGFRLPGRRVLGRNVSILMPSPHREEHDAHLARYLETGERRISGIGREVTGRRKDGRDAPGRKAVDQVFFMSGYTSEQLGHHGAEGPAIRILEKPFTLHGLARRVRETLTHTDPGPGLRSIEEHTPGDLVTRKSL